MFLSVFVPVFVCGLVCMCLCEAIKNGYGYGHGRASVGKQKRPIGIQSVFLNNPVLSYFYQFPPNATRIELEKALKDATNYWDADCTALEEYWQEQINRIEAELAKKPK